jgi:phosphate transport system substrate-binding protein
MIGGAARTVRHRVGLVVGAFALLALGGCGGGRPAPVAGDTPVLLRIVGSDTMRPLVERWAEAYMRSHPGVAVYAEGGGTGVGMDELIEGQADLAAASRAMSPDEVQRLVAARGFLGIGVLAGKDALSVYVHPDNPVTGLAMEDLRAIFTGRSRNWSDFGGPDLPIEVLARRPTSGTFRLFQDHVLRGEDYAESARTMATTSAIVDAVAGNRAAIGYGGMAYGTGLTHLALEGVEPTRDHVRDGSYPLARYLHLYAAGPLEGEIGRFIDWVLADDGQRIVAEVGYIPLRELASP